MRPPAALAALCSDAPEDARRPPLREVLPRRRARASAREFPNPPDQVAFPRTEADVAALLDWCGDAGVAVVPYGGGSSVVGGVETAIVGDGYAGALSLDLGRLDRVLELDRTSRAARIQAGVLGPALEDQLRPHGLTLRHFPQSFEFSSLGGWIATRSGGHYATLYTHIDDFVESLRVVTPTGVVETRRLPGSGAGPAPDRLFIGSEGIARRDHRGLDAAPGPADAAAPAPRCASTGADGFLRGARGGARASRSRASTRRTAGSSTRRRRRPPAPATATHAVLVLGFESADHDLDAWIARALECCRDAGGQRARGRRGHGRARATPPAARRARPAPGARAFLQAPYLRDVLVACSRDRRDLRDGDHLGPLPRRSTPVMAADARRRGARLRRGHGRLPLHARLPGRRRALLQRARAGAAAGASSRSGRRSRPRRARRSSRSAARSRTTTPSVATTAPGYDRERPELFAAALRAAKRALDPRGILNPGVLIDP